MSRFLLRLGSVTKKQRNTLITAALLILVSVFGYYFVSSNESYYPMTIAKITSIAAAKAQAETGEQITQKLSAIVMNGPHKGEAISLQNTASYSRATELDLKADDEVFVTLKQNPANQIISAQILDFKRDTHLAYITILFVLLILLVGGFKGFRSLASVAVNITIVSAVTQLFLHGYNLVLIAAAASLLFIVLSISLVSGLNKKTFAAVIGTVIGTFASMLLAAAVMLLTHNNGVHYEEMEFLTSPPQPIFMAEILIGTLGAIMDIAITISASVEEMYQKNPQTEKKNLMASGMEIGKDIMGTMANTLVFAYISGSIPLILLWLANGNSPFYIVNINISLEIIRALTGSIGIVLSIPVTLFVTVMLLKKHRIGEGLQS